VRIRDLMTEDIVVALVQVAAEVIETHDVLVGRSVEVATEHGVWWRIDVNRTGGNAVIGRVVLEHSLN